MEWNRLGCTQGLTLYKSNAKMRWAKKYKILCKSLNELKARITVAFSNLKKKTAWKACWRFRGRLGAVIEGIFVSAFLPTGFDKMINYWKFGLLWRLCRWMSSTSRGSNPAGLCWWSALNVSPMCLAGHRLKRESRPWW